MRTITHIIIHCSATRLGQEITIQTIDGWHRQRGYAHIDCHYIIIPNGTMTKR